MHMAATTRSASRRWKQTTCRGRCGVVVRDSAGGVKYGSYGRGRRSRTEDTEPEMQWLITVSSEVDRPPQVPANQRPANEEPQDDIYMALPGHIVLPITRCTKAFTNHPVDTCHHSPHRHTPSHLATLPTKSVTTDFNHINLDQPSDPPSPPWSQPSHPSPSSEPVPLVSS